MMQCSTVNRTLNSIGHHNTHSSLNFVTLIKSSNIRMSECVTRMSNLEVNSVFQSEKLKECGRGLVAFIILNYMLKSGIRTKYIALCWRAVRKF